MSRGGRPNRRTSGRVTTPSGARPSEWSCVDCKFYVDSRPDYDCPRCGEPFTERRAAPEPDDTAWFNVKVSVFECDECHGRYLLEPDERCPHCGAPANDDEPAWTDRNATFGPTLDLLHSRWNTWTAVQPQFSSRGERLELTDHLSLISDTMKRTSDLLSEAQSICQRTDWAADAAQSNCSNLDALVAVADGAMDAVTDLAQQPPPLALLSVHRQAARALKSGADAIVRMTLLHTAKYHSQALQEMDVVQTALDKGAERMAQVNVLLDRADRVLLAPGFWALGAEYETGRVAWEGVDAKVSTVTDAAAVVRDTFKDIPGIVDLPDEQAFALLPAAAIGASFQDPERLIDRAVSVRSLLDTADRTASWVADAPLLAERVWEGHRQLVDQVVKVGYAIRTDTPRKLLIDTALDAFSKFVEGPLRRLGGVVAVASNAGSGEVFDQATCDQYKPAKTIEALNHAAPHLLAGMDSLLRHAEAHYDYSLDDDGVTVNHLPPRGNRGRITDHFTDEDLFEQLLNLNEALIAIELALLPYLWSFPNDAVHAILEQKSNSVEAAFEVLRALGGLKGWTDVTFEVEGDVLHVDGTYLGPEGANPVVDLLPMVAAAWTALPDVRNVAVRPAESGAATLARHQFLPTEQNEGIRLHRTAALLADTRSQTDGGDDARWKATALLLPAAVVPWQLVNEVVNGLSEVSDALHYIRWLTPQLQEAHLAGAFAELRDTLLSKHATTAKLLGVASAALAQSDQRFIARCEKDLRRHLRDLAEVRSDALALLYGIV